MRLRVFPCSVKNFRTFQAQNEEDMMGELSNDTLNENFWGREGTSKKGRFCLPARKPRHRERELLGCMGELYGRRWAGICVSFATQERDTRESGRAHRHNTTHRGAQGRAKSGRPVLAASGRESLGNLRGWVRRGRGEVRRGRGERRGEGQGQPAVSWCMAR